MCVCAAWCGHARHVLRYVCVADIACVCVWVCVWMCVDCAGVCASGVRPVSWYAPFLPCVHLWVGGSLDVCVGGGRLCVCAKGRSREACIAVRACDEHCVCVCLGMGVYVCGSCGGVCVRGAARFLVRTVSPMRACVGKR